MQGMERSAEEADAVRERDVSYERDCIDKRFPRSASPTGLGCRPRVGSQGPRHGPHHPGRHLRQSSRHSERNASPKIKGYHQLFRGVTGHRRHAHSPVGHVL